MPRCSHATFGSICIDTAVFVVFLMDNRAAGSCLPFLLCYPKGVIVHRHQKENENSSAYIVRWSGT